MMQSISMYRGDTKLISVSVLDQSGDPYDLTGCTVWMTAKEDVTDADIDAIIQKDSGGNGITISSPTSGVAVIEILPTDTDSLTVDSTLVYDVQIKDTDDRIWTLGTGSIVITSDITRTTT